MIAPNDESKDKPKAHSSTGESRPRIRLAMASDDVRGGSGNPKPECVGIAIARGSCVACAACGPCTNRGRFPKAGGCPSGDGEGPGSSRKFAWIGTSPDAGKRFSACLPNCE